MAERFASFIVDFQRYSAIAKAIQFCALSALASVVGGDVAFRPS